MQQYNISSDAFQMVAWSKLQQSIFSLLDSVNAINIGVVRKQLLKLNIIRGKGIFCEFVTKVQSVSIGYTHVYATLVASINLVFPIIGELLLIRCIMLFKEAYYHNEKSQCKASAIFIAHLINHSVVDEILAIDILKFLINSPNEISIEVSLDILNTCGKKISEYYKKEMDELFNAMQIIVNDTVLDEQVQYLIKTVIDLYENGFKINKLDSVPDDGQKMHILTLDSTTNINDIIDHYEFDPNYAVNELNYKLAAMGLQESDSEDEEKENIM